MRIKSIRRDSAVAETHTVTHTHTGIVMASTKDSPAPAHFHVEHLKAPHGSRGAFTPVLMCVPVPVPAYVAVHVTVSDCYQCPSMDVESCVDGPPHTPHRIPPPPPISHRAFTPPPSVHHAASAGRGLTLRFNITPEGSPPGGPPGGLPPPMLLSSIATSQHHGGSRWLLHHPPHHDHHDQQHHPLFTWLLHHDDPQHPQQQQQQQIFPWLASQLTSGQASRPPPPPTPALVSSSISKPQRRGHESSPSSSAVAAGSSSSIGDHATHTPATVEWAGIGPILSSSMVDGGEAMPIAWLIIEQTMLDDEEHLPHPHTASTSSASTAGPRRLVPVAQFFRKVLRFWSWRGSPEADAARRGGKLQKMKQVSHLPEGVGEEERPMYELFRTLDVDSSGSIDATELRRGLTSMGLPCSR